MQWCSTGGWPNLGFSLRLHLHTANLMRTPEGWLLIFSVLCLLSISEALRIVKPPCLHTKTTLCFTYPWDQVRACKSSIKQYKKLAYHTNTATVRVKLRRYSSNPPTGRLSKNLYICLRHRMFNVYNVNRHLIASTKTYQNLYITISLVLGEQSSTYCICDLHPYCTSHKGELT